jgi:predicted DCC family thiol-disulfide oxidoreductase YuxK
MATGSKPRPDTPPIVLFDGVCNLCSGSVQFLIRRDPQARLRFASLQSVTGRRLQTERGLDPERLASMVLVAGDRWYEESSGVLRMVRYLSGAWPLLAVFLLVPRPLRDLVYRWIARNRYRWFGKKESCWLPTPELESRFLE